MSASTQEAQPALDAPQPAEPADRRQRRRRRTREEIARVALELAAERGYDQVTVDEIAEAADIAPRTFFRYFTSKDDLFFVDHDERLDALRRALEERPADEPVLDSVRGAVLTLTDELQAHRDVALLKARLIDSTPSLRARSLERQGEWREVVVAAVSNRLGVDPTTDLRPQVMAAAVLGALQAGVRVWIGPDSTADLKDLVTRALDVLGEFGRETAGGR